MDVARRSAVDLVLNDSRVQHGRSYEAEANGDAHDWLQVDLLAVEQQIDLPLDKRPKHDAANLVYCGQKVIGRAAGLYLRSLGDQVVLHLIKADVEHNKCDAGQDQQAAYAAAMVLRRLIERNKHAGCAQAC
jgi:hypothetical protein